MVGLMYISTPIMARSEALRGGGKGHQGQGGDDAGADKQAVVAAG